MSVKMESLEKEVDYSLDNGLVMYTAGFSTRPLEGEPTPSEKAKMPSFGGDGKGLFGNGGLFGSGVSSKSLVDIDPYKPSKGLSDLCKGFSGVSSHPGDLFNKGSSGNLFTDTDIGDGWKLQERYDFSGHGGTNPHLNTSLVNPTGKVINHLENQKSKGNLLGESHLIDLPDFSGLIKKK